MSAKGSRYHRSIVPRHPIRSEQGSLHGETRPIRIPPELADKYQGGSIEDSHDPKWPVDTHGGGLATVTSIGIVWQQMGKVSTAVRSAAMSHIVPRLPTILGRRLTTYNPISEKQRCLRDVLHRLLA